MEPEGKDAGLASTGSPVCCASTTSKSTLILRIIISILILRIIISKSILILRIIISILILRSVNESLDKSTESHSESVVILRSGVRRRPRDTDQGRKEERASDQHCQAVL